ncbi:cytochrome P450 716B2 [Elaeis guineensis]|uniref:cytochrome P450 716B2 n=1 Tax=Elaeis guineensis var. tenera TaxID=51953 RepID=UPI003C6DA93B
MAIVALLVLFLALLPIIHLFLTKQRSSSKRLPPGSLGLPIIGQSLGLLRAMQASTGEQWLQGRIKRYGPISKLSLFGAPTIFLTGPAANKFIFMNEALVPQQPSSLTRILGKRTIIELVGEDHKRVRAAVMQFLKPDVLKNYVGKIDREVRHHLKMNWIGRQTVTVLPLMKGLTFDIICSLIFGLERGPLREGLGKDCADMLAGMWAVPLNLPFTHFGKSLRASHRARKVLTRITRERRAMVAQGQVPSSEDLITHLLTLGGEDGTNGLTDEEIVDNAMLVLVAGHDTSSTLMTFMMRHLANDQVTYAAVVHEQEEIAKSKAPGEALTWDDLYKMKYTWRVALEILRMIPPLFGSFRRALKDVEFDGYLIPKGWQVFWASSITHMDANIFQEPCKFDPTRFENQSSIPPYCFVAFGSGLRICPGSEFARIETLVTMHYLATRFKWRLCCRDDAFVRDPLPSPTQGLPVELEPKNKEQLMIVK